MAALRIPAQVVRRQDGRDLPAAAAAVLFGRRGLMGGRASSARCPSVVRMMSTGGGDAGAAAAKDNPGLPLTVLSGGGSGGSAGNGAGGGSGGSVGGGLGAGIAGSSLGCNCAKDLAQLRADMMAENHKMWKFCSDLMRQDGKIVNQLADVRIETTKSYAEAGQSLRKLTSNLIFSGASLTFGLVTFMMPYVKEKWQSDTVEEVFTKLEKLEKKSKEQDVVEASDEPKDSGAKTVDKKSVNKTEPVVKIVKNTGDSTEAPKKKKWGLLFGF